MLTPAKDHATISKAFALERLCGCGTIALRNAGVPGGRICGGGLRGGCCDGGHVVVVVVGWRRGRVSCGGEVVGGGRGLLAVHLATRRAGTL